MGLREDHEESVNHFKDLIEDQGLGGQVTEVISLRQLKVEHKPYEAKLALARRFDIFLADDRIVRFLPKFLGKPFYARKKFPVPVNLRAKDLKKEVERGVHTINLPLSHHGTTSRMVVGYTAMEQDAVVANLVAALSLIGKRYPGGVKNIRSLHIKTENSPAVPIHINTGSGNELGFVDADVPQKISLETVSGELSTQPGMEVTVTPFGTIKISKSGDPGWDDHKDEPFVSGSEAEEESDKEEDETKDAKKKEKADNKKRKADEQDKKAEEVVDKKKSKKDQKKKKAAEEESDDSEEDEINQTEMAYMKRALDEEESQQKEKNGKSSTDAKKSKKKVEEKPEESKKKKANRRRKTAKAQRMPKSPKRKWKRNQKSRKKKTLTMKRMRRVTMRLTKMATNKLKVKKAKRRVVRRRRKRMASKLKLPVTTTKMKMKMGQSWNSLTVQTRKSMMTTTTTMMTTTMTTMRMVSREFKRCLMTSKSLTPKTSSSTLTPTKTSPAATTTTTRSCWTRTCATWRRTRAAKMSPRPKRPRRPSCPKTRGENRGTKRSRRRQPPPAQRLPKPKRPPPLHRQSRPNQFPNRHQLQTKSSSSKQAANAKARNESIFVIMICRIFMKLCIPP